MKRIWLLVSTITLLAMFTATVNVMAGPAASEPLRSALKPTKTPRVKPTKTPRVKNARKNYQGSLAAVDAGSLTLTLKDGSSLTFVLTADTKIKISGLGHSASLADLAVGDSATVHASQDESGLLVAASVDVKRAKPKPEHYSGTVTDYQPGASLTIQDQGGAALTFLVTTDTRIKFGRMEDSNALTVGCEVNITALRDPASGVSTASEIKVHKKKAENYQGSLAAVDASSLTLTLKDGTSLAFVLTSDTKIRISGLDGEATPADLTVGDSATVRASEDETGLLVASSVAVKLPKPKPEHYSGTVTDYQPGASLTIQDKDGAALTFLITADTRIKFGRKDDSTALAVGSEVNITALLDPASGASTASEIKVHKKKAENYHGVIAAVDASSLTLTLKDGSSLTFVLEADTRVKVPGLGHAATPADLTVGVNAAVRASEDETGLLVASSVEVKRAKPEHYAGTVTDYQPGASLTILDKEGAALTFLVTAETRIKFGRKDDHNALAVGSEVTVVVLGDSDDGTPTADEIVVHKKKAENYHGSLAAFDASSLTLTLKDGSSLAFVLTSDTKVNIPGLGHEATLADLVVGEYVTVRATEDETEALVATDVHVSPGKPDKLHRVGTVSDYQPGASITIQDKEGNSYTFLLSPEAKILPAERLGQLAVGSRVTIISPRDVTGGSLTALAIVVHPAKTGEGAAPTEVGTPAETEPAEPAETGSETATPSP